MEKKRWLGTIGVFVLTGAVLGACGDKSHNGNAGIAPASESAATEAEDGASGTRKVTTAKGDIDIPTNPGSVVAGYYHGTLLALGIQPVGASKEWWMGSPFLEEQEMSIEDIGSPASSERIIALSPDLIVINDLLEENYDQLSKIAPTLFVPYGATNNIREEVKLFGDLLDKKEEAAAWLAQYESKAEQARERLQGKVEPGATAVLLEIDGKSLAVLGDNYGRGGEVIYNALKFEAPEWVRANVIDNQVQYQEISLESLPEIANTDYIFLSTYTETTEEQFREMTDSEVWKSLPAVKNGHLIPIDYKTYFYFDPVSTLGQIDTLTATLLNNG